MENYRSGCFWKYSGMPTSVWRQIIEFIFSLIKNDFCFKRDGSKSRKSHFCNIKYWRLWDGEQYVPVFFKVLWYANKCIAPDVRIHLFFGQKMTFVSKGMAQISGKPHFCSIKYRKLCDGEQHGPGVFQSTLECQQAYRARCSNSSFLWSKNDFCIKRDGTKIGKTALLQYKISEALRWRATRPGVFQSTLECQQVYRARCSNSSFLWQKNDFCINKDGSKSGKSQFCSIKYRKLCDGEQHVMVFFKVLWYANKCIVSQIFEFIFSLVENITFVSRRMVQKSGKSHFCSIKYRKLCDGEQHLMVFLKVLWYANKCIPTDFRINLFFVQKMTFVSKGMAQKSGKSRFCNIKYRKLYDGEQHVMVFLKLLRYANKCFSSDVRIHLFFGQKNNFCIKRDGSEIKSHVCNIKYRKLCDGEQHLVFFKVLWNANMCIAPDIRFHLFFGQINDFCIKRDGSKSGKSHVCNIKYRKLCGGEQHEMMCLKVLWYANKCMATDFRIHLFFGQKNDFCITKDVSKNRTFAI